MANSTMAAVMFTGCAAISGCAHLDAPAAQQVRLGVPLVRHHDSGLGSAEMLSRYYNAPLAPRAERLLRLSARAGGVSAYELRAALEASGYHVDVYEGRLQRLYESLDAGSPVVVLLGSHYVLVDGYDTDGVRLLDPQRGTLTASAEDFDKAWRDSRRFTLVAGK